MAEDALGLKYLGLKMYNEKGKVAVKIDFEDDNPRLRLFNEDEKTTVEVTSSELGSNLALLNPGGKQGLLIGISLWGLSVAAHARCERGQSPEKSAEDSDGPHLVFGKDNKPHCRLGLSGAHQAGHLLFAKDNKVYWSAP